MLTYWAQILSDCLQNIAFQYSKRTVAFRKFFDEDMILQAVVSRIVVSRTVGKIPCRELSCRELSGSLKILRLDSTYSCHTGLIMTQDHHEKCNQHEYIRMSRTIGYKEEMIQSGRNIFNYSLAEFLILYLV